MARLPFNPEIATGAKRHAPAERESQRQPMTVSQAAQMLRGVMADHLPAKLRIVGEVSNLSDRQHWFFSLKDQNATLRCVCFASAARRIGFPVADGAEVVATGRIDFYDAQGHVQLYVDKLEPVGQGALELRLRQLCDELRRLGYFAPEAKRALPLLPRRIAVVTSRSAAALRDVIETARQRWRGCELLLVDVRVQGAAAAGQIARAIRALDRDGAGLGIDAVILTRGGGSIEDLWAFNERVVADALFACRLPVVAAIGHETDTTVAELVADTRASTPTQAAMMLVPDAAALAHQLDQAQRRVGLALRRVPELGRELARLGRDLDRAVAARLRHQRQGLDAWAQAVARLEPRARLARERRGLADAAQRLARGLSARRDAAQQRLRLAAQRIGATVRRRLGNDARRLDAAARQLGAVGPQRVLERGYSYTLGPDGKVLRRASDIAAGQRITTQLADGRVTSRVESGGRGPVRRRAEGVPGPGLFDPPSGGGVVDSQADEQDAQEKPDV